MIANVLLDAALPRESISGLNETLQEAIKQKFEHLYAVSSVIRESVKESDLDSDLDDLDDLESEE